MTIVPNNVSYNNVGNNVYYNRIHRTYQKDKAKLKVYINGVVNLDLNSISYPSGIRIDATLVIYLSVSIGIILDT